MRIVNDKAVFEYTIYETDECVYFAQKIADETIRVMTEFHKKADKEILSKLTLKQLKTFKKMIEEVIKEKSERKTNDR